MVNLKNVNLPRISKKTKDLVNLIPDLSNRKFANLIFGVLKDAKAEEIVFVDAKGKSYFTDYLIICQGISQPHCKSIAEKVESLLKNKGFNSLGMEGEKEVNWGLLDYGEFMVHVFHPEIRKYYNLEGLYSRRFWLDYQKNKVTLRTNKEFNA